MERWWRWFCGYIQVGLRGRQINRFLNLCSRNNISLWNVTQDIEHYIKVHLRLRDFYFLKPFLRKTKTKLRIIGRHGFPFWCYRHPRLKWFPVFLLALACLGIYSSTFIWDIRIEGNYQVSEQELLQFLAEQEIEIGKKRNSVDCSQIEYDIRKKFGQLGWVSVYMDRTNLYVEVRESLYDKHEDYVRETKRYDLVANKDAYIYSMITRAGTAVVEQGAYVKAGEVLVEGLCDIYDDAGVVKETLQLKAEAQILADVEYEYLEPLNEMEIVSLKIAGLYTDEMLNYIGNIKINRFLENLEENGVIILDKSVMIEKNEKSIAFRMRIKAREELGINIPVEEMETNESEREDNSNTG